MGFYNYCYFLLEFKHKGVTVLQDLLDVSISLLNLFFFLLSSYLKNVILLIFLLIVAYYITNFIVPSINKSTLGTGDYPEINPKNDWWKDVKDTIFENKTTIFFCSVSMGIAIYSYHKYQTSYHLAETLKQTIEVQQNLANQEETRFTLKNSFSYMAEETCFILKDSFSFIELEHLKNLNKNLNRNIELLVQKQEKEKALFDFQLQKAHYQKLYSIADVMRENSYVNDHGKTVYSIDLIVDSIEKDFLKTSIVLREDYNNQRKMFLNQFFDAFRFSDFTKEFLIKNPQFIDVIGVKFEECKLFISLNPYVIDRNNPDYLAFEESLKFAVTNPARCYAAGDEVSINFFFDKFYQAFFTYDAVNDLYLTDDATQRQKLYFHPLKTIRENLILKKTLDFESSFKQFYGNSVADHSSERRLFFVNFFFPSVYKDFFISNSNDLTFLQRKIIDEIYHKVTYDSQGFFLDKNKFKDNLTYLMYNIPDLNIVRLDEIQLDSFVESFYPKQSVPLEQSLVKGTNFKLKSAKISKAISILDLKKEGQ